MKSSYYYCNFMESQDGSVSAILASSTRPHSFPLSGAATHHTCQNASSSCAWSKSPVTQGLQSSTPRTKLFFHSCPSCLHWKWRLAHVSPVTSGWWGRSMLEFGHRTPKFRGKKKIEDTQIWISDKQQIGFLVYVYPKYCMQHTYAKRLFVAYSKFKFNGVPFSGRRYSGIEAAWIFGQKTPAHSP